MYSRRYRDSRSRSRELSLSVKSFDMESGYSRSRTRSRSSESEYRLHIADIADGVKKYEIQEIFEDFGELKEIWMANCPPCFGFAVFYRKSSAVAAIKATDGMMLHGSRIRVTHAKPRTRGTGRRYFNYNMRCYECGDQGHFYRDCPKLYDEDDYGKSPKTHRLSRRRSSDYRRRRYSRDRYGESRRHRR